MKKLMIAAAIVCAAAMSQAAAMYWASADPLKDPTGAEACGNCQITMYLWSIDSATYDTLSKSADIGAAVWAKYGSLENPTKSMLEEEGAMTLKDTKTYTVGDTAYAAIIFAYDPEQDGNITYYKGNIGMWEFKTSSDKTISGMDKFVGGGTSGTAVTWTEAVPEPTSGLLLLLGVAGLALRRRRA